MAYSKVDETFWHDPAIRALSERARTLYLYLLTCPHRNRFGCFVLDPWYASADLQWDRDAVIGSLQELHSAGRISWDETHRVVFIQRYLKHNTLENHKVVQGALGDLRSLPSTPLLHDLLASMEEHKRAHYLPLLQALRNRLVNDTANGMPYRRDLPLPLPSPSPSPLNPPSASQSPPPSPNRNGSSSVERLVECIGEKNRQAVLDVSALPDAGPTWAAGLLAQYGPGELTDPHLNRIPEAHRPRALALALDRTRTDGKRWYSPWFRKVYLRAADEVANPARGSPTPFQELSALVDSFDPAELKRWYSLRDELEAQGVDPEEAADTAARQVRQP